jgi:Pvc16 N-terminal domain
VIDDALNFICDQLTDYLQLKLDIPTGGPIQLANITTLQDGNTGSTTTETYNTFLSLVNIEEDRISESQKNHRRIGGILINENPKVHLNLYVLFAVNLANYPESLKRLSLIIQFFQYQNVFNPLNSPSLPTGIEKLIFDLVTLSFQDLNNLWGILGSKYLPSVMYKVRMIKISEEFKEGTAPLVQEIIVNDNGM